MAYVVDIAEIEAELTALGVPIPEFLARAAINRSTWQRLKAGEYSPRQDTARRIHNAMKVLRVAYGGNPSGGGTDSDPGDMDCSAVEKIA